MASSSRSRDISQDEWEEYSTEITSLFQSKTYDQIIEHLGRKFDFHPSRNQFGLQVRKRWKLKKNFKRKSQQDAFAKLQAHNERPTEILIDNRPISFKKLKKTAVAMSTAQRKQVDGHTKRAAIEEHSDDGSASNQLGESDSLMTQHRPSRERHPIDTSPTVKEASTALSEPHRSGNIEAADPHAPFAQFSTCLDVVTTYLGEVLSITSTPSTVDDPDVPQSPPADVEGMVSANTVRRVTPWMLKVFHQIDLESQLPECAMQVLRRLRHSTGELMERELVKDISTYIGLGKYATSLHLLRSKIHLAANNHLNESAMNQLLKDISKKQLFWIVEILLCSHLPTMAIFADVLFQSAVALGDVTTATALIAKGIDPNGGANVGVGYRRRPLQIAIENGDEAMVLALLGSGAKVNNLTTIYTVAGVRDVPTDLKTACKGSKLHAFIIRLLLQHGADINTQIPQGRNFTSILNRALQLNAIDVVKELLTHPDLDKEEPWQTIYPIQMAAMHCSNEVVQLLIEAGSDVNTPIRSKYPAARTIALSLGNAAFFVTPLQHAAQRDDLAMVKTLLASGASVDGFDFHRQFPDGHYITDDINVQVISKESSEPYKNLLSFLKQQRDYESPLQAAASNKNLEMVQLFLKKDPKMNMMGSLGTALQVACMQPGNFKVIKLLIENGADVNSPGHPKHGQTALQASILTGDLDVVEYLLECRADINACASAMVGLTALQAAIKMENVTLVRRLIKLGAAVNDKASQLGAKSSLYLAVRSGNVELFDLLANNGADLEIPHWHHTALIDAISAGSHAMVERVLKSKTVLGDPEAIYYGPAYVAAAVTHGSYEMIALLLSFGASPDARDEDGRTPLQLAIRQGKPRIARQLVLHGADVNAKSDDSSSALTDAIRKQDEELVRFLLGARANVDLPVTDELLAPVAVGISTGNLHIVYMVLQATKTPYSGRALFTGLAGAIKIGSFEVVQHLLKMGLRARDTNGELYLSPGPLQQAIEQKHEQIIDLLLDHDVEFYLSDPGALTEAVRIGNLSLVKRLLKLKLDFAGQGSSNLTCNEALKEAISRMKYAMAEALIAAGADVNAVWKLSESGKASCPLNLAVMSGWLEMVSLCIRKGAHINGLTDIGYHDAGPTPLQLAAKRGDSSMIKLLLDSGASVNTPAAEDAGGALEMAAENGRLDAVFKMLKHDKEPETLKRRIELAAQRAEKNGFPVVAKYLRHWQTSEDGQNMYRPARAWLE